MEEYQTVSRTRIYRQKRRKKKTRKLSLLSLSLVLFFLGCLSIFGYGYWKLDQIFNGITESGSNTVNAATHGPPSLQTGGQNEEETEQPFAIAVFGTDTRDGSGGTLNTDVIMVALVDPNTQSVRLLSIPRDTKVEIPGYPGYHKVNSVYFLGDSIRRSQERRGQEITETGTSLVKKTLSELVDIPIDYHVHIGFDGFIEVVDAVNGVKVNVKRSMEYDDVDGTHIRLQPGEQELDGKNALDYVRHRLDNRGPSYFSSDYERNERQQEVIRGIVNKLISFEGVTNINKVLEAITDNVSTNFTPDQMRKLTWKFKTLKTSNIISIENEAYWDSNQKYTIIPDVRLSEIRQEFQEILNGGR